MEARLFYRAFILPLCFKVSNITIGWIQHYTYIDYLYLFSIRLMYTKYLKQVILQHIVFLFYSSTVHFLAFMAELIQMSNANWCYKHVLHCFNIPCPIEMYPLNSGGKNIGFSAIDPDGRKFYYWSCTC